jgi:hypothetical protein
MANPARYAVDRCKLCIDRLSGRQPHLTAEEETVPLNVPPHFSEISALLITVHATMQRAVESEDLTGDDITRAIQSLNLAVVRFDDTREQGEFPLPEEFEFDLYRIRRAILKYDEGGEFEIYEDTLSESVLPPLEVSAGWNRQRCAVELTRHLRRRMQLIKGFAIHEMVNSLQDIERELEKDIEVEPDLALCTRLILDVEASFILNCPRSLRPYASSIKGLIRSVGEAIGEAKTGRKLPRVY